MLRAIKFQVFVVISFFLLVYGSAELLAVQKGDRGRGTVYGLKETVYPDWFKNSFLDLSDDVAEAKQNSKRVMLIFYQDLCPYCYELVNKNLSQASIENYLKTHFDVIAMHMWGGREVISVDGETHTEKSFAKSLAVQFTPTIVFLDEKGEEVLRLNGYLRPKQFKQALEYVAQHQEKNYSYRKYVSRTTAGDGREGVMNRQDFFLRQHDLSQLAGKGKPLAVFFEQADCPDCDYLHTAILNRDATRTIVKDFNNIQLGMWSERKIVTPQGQHTTAREWARELGIRYVPTILLFDESGKEVIRMEAVFENFHVQSTFDYVRSGAFRDEPVIENYYKRRARTLLDAGVDIHVWHD